MIEAHDIAFSYGDRVVLDGVSLTTARGEVVSLLGPNGSGKSTLLKILLGLLAPQRGDVTVDGHRLASLSYRRRARLMAYVPQAHALSFPYRVLDVVLLGRLARQTFFGRPSCEDLRLATDALARLGIGHLAQRAYTAISGGEQQLTLIARALAQGADTLIMDEPVSGLDYGNQLRILCEMQTLAQDGLTVLKSTHFPDHVFLGSDRVILLHRGKILSAGAPDEAMTDEHLERLYDVKVKIMSRDDGVRCCVPLSVPRIRAVERQPRAGGG